MNNQITFKGQFEAGADGAFTGFASISGNVDYGGDRVMPGAFKDDMAERGSRRPLLWQHDAAQPIGFVELAEHSKGLRVTKGQLVMEVERAREAHALLKARVIDGLSIGYTAIRPRIARDGVRELGDIKLHEVSLVTFPMNTLARIEAVKGNEAELRSLLSMLRSARLSIETEADRKAAAELRTTLTALRFTRLNIQADALLDQIR